jgi:hypothetical protein
VTRQKAKQDKAKSQEEDVVQLEVPAELPPTFPKNFQSLVKDKVTPHVPGYELITSDLKMVRSVQARKRLTEWCIYEARVVVLVLVLTGMFVCVCSRGRNCVCEVVVWCMLVQHLHNTGIMRE